MQRTYSEIRKYDVFGAVKINYEFAGDINDQDFEEFKDNFLCKKEVDVPRLNNRPLGFVEQSKNTLKEWGIKWI